MKLFTLFFACSLGLAHASESYAQKAIVNVEVQNKTVGEILKEIEKQSEFDFFFDNTLIDLNRRVSVTSRNGDIFKVLEKVFKGTNVKYSILDKKIVLTTNADNTQTVQQITFKVIGKVVDNMGESVIGATVLEQGTTNGTVTDMDGNFELVVSNKEVTLEISYIGYSKSVVKSKVGVPVTLKEDTEVFDEVLVV
ncbi:carboxypeptidase-like regulatory domain-containing protein, partial [Phocaeicola sp.]|uniref:STN domain-containing protein n=1 Tax=Phocaeicola sp. TaxID=2773926 RepID=UPI003AB61D6D